MPIRTTLDSTDAKTRAAHDLDNGPDGLASWARGEQNFENNPNSEHVRGVGLGMAELREIPATGPALTDTDKADLEAGRAVITFAHDAQLTDKDRELIQSGKGLVKPQPISRDKAGSLSKDELSRIASGAAEFVSSSAPAPAEFQKGTDGRLQIPRERLHEAMDRGLCSLDDVASGKVNVIG